MVSTISVVGHSLSLHHIVYLSGKYFLVEKQLHTGLDVE
jgi:hypothetical protein